VAAEEVGGKLSLVVSPPLNPRDDDQAIGQCSGSTKASRFGKCCRKTCREGLVESLEALTKPVLPPILAFHNVVSMTKAIDRLKADGQEISDEVLAAVSPYQTSHINRFGQYQLHARRAPDPLPFLRKPPNVELGTVDSPGLVAAG
jgi:hypothetical protein